MSKKLSSFMLFALAILLASCASMQPDLSPAQRLFALQAEYNALQEVAADYCENPDAIPEIKQTIKRIDQETYEVFLKVRTGILPVVEAIPKIEEAIREISEKIIQSKIV